MLVAATAARFRVVREPALTEALLTAASLASVGALAGLCPWVAQSGDPEVFTIMVLIPAVSCSVGCIVCADGAQAMGSTLAAMRSIVHALRGWPTPFGATLNASAKPFGAPGQAADPAAVQACELVADEVVQFAGWIRPR